MFNRKKKKHVEEVVYVEEERFKIPQIDYGAEGLIKKRERFQPSKVCSPFHGSNVLDKQAFIDTKGTYDVDYNYDFIRNEKHISDEELIKRHGTKYYEFTIANRENMAELYGGSDYNKQDEENIPQDEEYTPFTFISSLDEISNINDDLSDINYNPSEEDIPDEIDYSDENAEFRLNLNIEFNDDEADTYEYNTYDKKMDAPVQANIPSFLTSKDNNDAKEEKVVELSFGDEEESIEGVSYSNPPVDKNLTIEEAIAKMNNGEPNTVAPAQPQKPERKPQKPEAPTQNINKYANYSIPYNKIFSKGKGNVDEHPEWLEEKKEIINQILKSFGIDGEVVTYTKGPAFTRYEILLAPGVNVKKINQIYDNLQKDLQAESLRVLAPIPGKNTIGVEVPNDVADMVSFGDLVDDSYINNGKPLSVALGKNIDGSIVYQNITDMPHALIAGATQSGKSVSINTILVSLLVKNSPEDLKLILVDPKRVELAFYNDIPHLATPVIDDAVIATEALKWSVAEMERRYDVLARNRVRNIGDYRKKRADNPMMENLPYIVIIVDEFNDLVMQCGAEANDCIIRLAQKARACGIHVILATQRPTVDVVNGTIKANITCRIAFRVASDVDSRTILDEVGAESLLGRGDMIIKNNGNPVRAQGAYISDDEINDVCTYLVDTYGEDYLFTHIDLKKSISNNSSSGGSHREAPSESEDLLYEIALYCINSGLCSINSIQNQFQLGFNRASRIVQILEDREIVSPKNGTKGREILIDTYKLREIFHVDEE